MYQASDGESYTPGGMYELWNAENLRMRRFFRTVSLCFVRFLESEMTLLGMWIALGALLNPSIRCFSSLETRNLECVDSVK